MTVLSKERKKILEILHSNPQSIGQIRQMTDTETGWANLFYHMKVLERFGYVESERTEVDAVSKTSGKKKTTLYTLTEKGEKIDVK